MATRIVSLMARLGLDGSGFQRGMDDAQNRMRQFGSGIKGQLAGIFSAAAAISWARHVSNAVGRIKDLSEQFQVTTDEVQRFDAAAKMSGQTFEDVGAATERLGKARQEAAEGNEDLRKQFRRFGITIEDLNNPMLRNIDLLGKMVEATRTMNMTAAESQALRELLGKSGARLAAVFDDLSKVKIQLISEEDIKAIDEMEKSLGRLWQRLLAFTARNASGAGKIKWEDISQEFLPAHWLRKLTGKAAPQVPMTDEEALMAQPISSKEIQEANQAKRARLKGPLFEEDLKNQRELGQSQQREADKALALRERIFNANLKLLDTEHRKLEIARRINEIEAKAKSFIGPKMESDILDKQEEVARLRGELLGEFMRDKGRPLDVTLTEMERRGAFAGLSTQRAFGLTQPGRNNDAREIKIATQRAARLLDSIDRKVGKGGDLTF